MLKFKTLCHLIIYMLPFSNPIPMTNLTICGKQKMLFDGYWGVQVSGAMRYPVAEFPIAFGQALLFIVKGSPSFFFYRPYKLFYYIFRIHKCPLCIFDISFLYPLYVYASLVSWIFHIYIPSVCMFLLCFWSFMYVSPQCIYPYRFFDLSCIFLCTSRLWIGILVW